MKEFVELENEATWDGHSIWIWAVTARGRIKCQIPRSTIHAMPPFEDAITREIARDTMEIIDRLRPILLNKIAFATGAIGPLPPIIGFGATR
jgi:hypothetical protein